jgi:hypothetical protein
MQLSVTIALQAATGAHLSRFLHLKGAKMTLLALKGGVCTRLRINKSDRLLGIKPRWNKNQPLDKILMFLYKDTHMCK